MVDELYQEFFLALCEIKDKRLIKANNEGYLDVLCVGIIHNIWNKRNRVKTYENGSTSRLHEMSNGMKGISTVCFGKSDSYDGPFSSIDEVNECFIADVSEMYDEKIDHQHNLIQNTVDRDKANGGDEGYKARVFWYSHTLFKNPKQFSKHTHISYRATLLAYHGYREKLQNELKLCRISS